ncbi:50S ribosomal L17 [Pyrenophora seminiperda CCB06]|uniref:50S ribosomal L17 n=1 Tax=Pyrenophora seminiperda CCB06 TaxID=1302712 RepID=A0A3M7LV40_9PLEO|nr:50S ribosomal L17 [Pyrenophora seminiperda CCB06]
MAQGQGSAGLGRKVGHAGEEEHRGYSAEGDADILCTAMLRNCDKWPTDNGQEPNLMVPKLFGPIRERYAERQGGYTRVLRIEPMKEDQAESAILELVDGPKDMRFAMTAKSLARRDPSLAFSPDVTTHVKKATQFRKNGIHELRVLAETLRQQHKTGLDDRILPKPRSVYPQDSSKEDLRYFEEVDDHKRPNPPRIDSFKRIHKRVQYKLRPRVQKKRPQVQKPVSDKENQKQIA